MSETIHSTSETFQFHSIQRFAIPHGELRHQPLHRHPSAVELLLVAEGCVHCKIGTQSYSLPSGTAIFVPPGSWHELEYPAAPKQSGYRLSFASPHLKPDLVADVPRVIQVDDLAGIIPLFARLEQENELPHPDSRIIHHLVGLISALLDRSTDTQNSLNSREAEKRSDALSFIWKNTIAAPCRSKTLPHSSAWINTSWRASLSSKPA